MTGCALQAHLAQKISGRLRSSANQPTADPYAQKARKDRPCSVKSSLLLMPTSTDLPFSALLKRLIGATIVSVLTWNGKKYLSKSDAASTPWLRSVASADGHDAKRQAHSIDDSVSIRLTCDGRNGLLDEETRQNVLLLVENLREPK